MKESLPRIFVNLPLGYSHGPHSYFELFLERSIQPEIGLDNIDLASPAVRDRLHSMSGRLRERGLACAVHLPFSRFEPERVESGRCDVPAELALAVESARIFAPVRLVGHPYVHARSALDDVQLRIRAAKALWAGALEGWPDHPPLCLENVFDRSPDALDALVRAMDSPRMGVCLDVGHWHGFSGGAGRGDLAQWVAAFGKRILHLHLHDNDGSGDQHLGLGRGTIPWEIFFTALGKTGAAPTITLEPHSEDDFKVSMEFIRRHSNWFE